MGLKIFDPRTLSMASIVDEKLKNYYVDETSGNYIIETIVEYLARVTFEHRFPETHVTVLLPKEGSTPSFSFETTEDFDAGLNDFDGKVYGFVGGLADENFVEIPASHPPVTIGEESVNEFEIGSDQVLHKLSDPNLGDGIISGGIVSWVENYDYSVSAIYYQYLGLKKMFAGAYPVTLATADATNPRIDLIIFTYDVGFSVLTGTPAVDPVQPQVDASTQVELTSILVPALSTEPADVVSDLIYDENVEWTHGQFGVTVNYDSAVSPFHGSKCIDVGTLSNNDTLTFFASSPVLVNAYEMLLFHLKLKAVASTKNAMYVRFYLGGSVVSNEIAIAWLPTDITNWQSIVVKFADLVFTSTTFDKIVIRWSRVQPNTTTHAGLYLDFIRLQKGVIIPVFVDTIELIGDVLGSGKLGKKIPTVLRDIVTAGTFGSATKTVTITIDEKGRVIAITENAITSGTDGREIELSTSGGYVVWRYVGDVAWTNLFLIPEDGEDGRGIVSVTLTNTVGLVKTYTITFTDSTTTTFDVKDGADGASGGGGGAADEIVEVYVDFVDLLPYTYTCPFALRFTVLENEGSAPTLSVPLNTEMAQYQDIVITPTSTGLVILKGAIASTFSFDVYVDFQIAGVETYKCPYPLKFTSMEHEQTNAPTLSIALNTNTTKYQVQTITADAAGLVTLKATLL